MIDATAYMPLSEALTSAQQSAEAGDLDNYVAYLNDFIDMVALYSGTHVSPDVTPALNNSTNSVKAPEVGIAGKWTDKTQSLDERLPYIPYCHPITITGVITPSGSAGSYSWSISPSDSSKIEVIGDNLQGAISSTDSVTKTSICIHGKSTSTAVSIIFTFIPISGGSTSATYLGTIVDTNFSVLTSTATLDSKRKGSVTEPVPDVYLIESQEIKFWATIKINTTPEGINNCAADWDTGYLRNLITETMTWTFSGSGGDVSFATQYPPNGPPERFPLLDSAIPKNPSAFTGDNQSQNVRDTDAVGVKVNKNPTGDMCDALLEQYPDDSWAVNEIRKKFQYYGIFIEWNIATNSRTGEIRYLSWLQYEVTMTMEFNDDGTPKAQKPTTIINTTGGSGSGSVSPKTTGMTANDYIKQVPRPGGYGVSITRK